MEKVKTPRSERRAAFRRRQMAAVHALKRKPLQFSPEIVAKLLAEEVGYDDDMRGLISPHKEEEHDRARRKARKLAFATMTRDARVPR